MSSQTGKRPHTLMRAFRTEELIHLNIQQNCYMAKQGKKYSQVKQIFF